MKKLILIILSVLIICPLVTGCNGIGKEVKQTNKELTVYEGFAYRISDDMINDYKALYPNVNLKIIKQDESKGFLDTEQMSQKMSTAIMANSGSDLMVVDYLFWMEADVSKMMRSGVFADMSKYFKSDKEFNSRNYNQTVMNFGKVDNKQYVIPLFYNMPMLLSTKKILNKAGFDVSKCKDYWGFVEEIDLYAQKINENSPMVFPSGSSAIRDFYKYAGIDVFNYDKKVVKIDTPEFKRAADIYQRLCKKSEMYNNDFKGDQKGFLNNQKSLFEFYNSSSFRELTYSIIKLYSTSNEQPVMFPLRNKDGKINALYNTGVGVRNNSANKQNAYNFAKLLLSKKYQTLTNRVYVSSIPVLNSALKASYDEYLSKSWQVIENHNTEYKSVPLPKKDFDQYMGYINEITGAMVQTSADKVFWKNMAPFYKGEKSYEECIKNAKEQLQINLSE